MTLETGVQPDHDAPPRLLSRRYFPTVVGAIGLVTLGAFGNRAVTTVMPAAATDLGGLGWFGTASAAAMITLLVATALAGVLVDRRGPQGIITAGLVTFVLAQVVTGFAPSMVLVTVGRVLSGGAEGLLDVGLIVLLARALPVRLRAKVIAAFATAWILPSLLDPAAAGGFADLWGWRSAFLMPLLLVVPTALMLVGALRAVGRVNTVAARWSDEQRTTMRSAVVAAFALAATTVGAGMVSGSHAVLGACMLVGGVLLLGLTIRSLLPAGALRLRSGVPAVVGQRLLLTASFSSGSAFIPLMLTTVHDASATEAGVSLMVTGVFWAFGSQLVSLDRVQHVPPAGRHAAGMSLVTLGLLGPAALAVDLVPIAAGMSGWALASLGIGMSSNTLSTHLLDLSDDRTQGGNNAASTLAASIGSGIAMAAGGALVAAQAENLGTAFALLVLAAAALAALGAAAGRRIRNT